jgi:hypothetical protein
MILCNVKDDLHDIGKNIGADKWPHSPQKTVDTCKAWANKKSPSDPKSEGVLVYATSHLCFSTLYKGMKGSRMGTVLTYF